MTSTAVDQTVRVRENGPASADTTVLGRLLDAGIREDRARAHLDEGRVYVDDVCVTDPAHPVARGAHVRLRDLLPSDR